jgi:hypothetical protein
MPPIDVAEFLQGAAALAAAVRLLSLGLARHQAALFSFVLFNAVSQLFLFSLPVASALYFWSFVGYTVLNWVAGFLAVREMFALSMGAYPGIRTAARWALYAATTLSALLSLAITVSSWGAGRHGRSNLFYVEVADRSFVLTLSAIAGGLIFFLSRYPLDLLRNSYVSCGFFSAILLCQAFLDLVDSVRTHLFFHDFDTGVTLTCALLYTAWAACLRSEPALAPRRIGFEKPNESELLGELEAVNRLLGRMGRRS